MNSEKIQTDYYNLLYTYAYAFPDLAWKLWSWNLSFISFVQTLSPKAKENLYRYVNYTINGISSAISAFLHIYPTIMQWGTKPIQNWNQPHWIILSPIARIYLFWFPSNSIWNDEQDSTKSLEEDQNTLDSKSDESKLIYIGNQQVFGLGTLSIICSVYLKTGKWIRVMAEPSNFSIPIWKHVIEYFGAIDRSRPDAFNQVCESGHPILFYPSGSKEFYKSSIDSKYGIDFKEKHLFSVIHAMQYHGYSTIPFGMVGASDMVKILFNFPYNPKDFTKTIPIIMPISYQKQYLIFDKQIDTLQPVLPLYLPLVIQCTKVRDQAVDYQFLDGSNKYLLQSLYWIQSRLSQSYTQPEGVLYKTTLTINQNAKYVVINSARKVLEFVSDDQTTATIEEIQ